MTDGCNDNRPSRTPIPRAKLDIKPDTEALKRELADGTFWERIQKKALPEIEKEDRRFRFDGTTGQYRI